MNSVSAISLAAAVVGIIDVIGRTIKSLQVVHEHWKQADLTVTLLISQLTTLKAALAEIAEWISSSPEASPHHHQLDIDLESSITSCNVLITLIDGHISKLDWNENDSLDYESRAGVVLEDRTTEDCL